LGIRTIEQILTESQTIAVVGLSPRQERDSYQVAAYLQAQGYRIIPVNPNAQEVLGEQAYDSLSAVPHRVDIVDVFRRPEAVPVIVDEAIQCGAQVVWMQKGITHDAAAQKARAHRIDVVMDRCMMVDHRALLRGEALPSA
jgi:predicted CoA-binding protein